MSKGWIAISALHPFKQSQSVGDINTTESCDAQTGKRSKTDERITKWRLLRQITGEFLAIFHYVAGYGKVHYGSTANIFHNGSINQT